MTQDQWTTVADVASAVCLLGGAFLAFAAGVGVLRFPDLLARMHAGTKPQVLGLIARAHRARAAAAVRRGRVGAGAGGRVPDAHRTRRGAHGRPGRATARARSGSDLLVVDELTDDLERAQVRDHGRAEDDAPETEGRG